MSTHALILAAGPATRLSQLPQPKALLPIANQPAIQYCLSQLIDANIPTTIAIQPAHQPQFDRFLSQSALNLEHVHLMHVSEHSHTAHVLRQLECTALDIIVLPCDYINHIPIQHIISQHTTQTCTATIVLHPHPTPHIPPSTKSKKPVKTNYLIDHYTLINPPNTLLSLIHPSEILSRNLTMPASIISQFPHIKLRSDLYDPHIYIFSASVKELLVKYPNITSIRFDLVPYLARRQRTLSQRDVIGNVRVNTFITPGALRGNTIDNYLKLNLSLVPPPYKGKKNRRKLPFSHGERCTVAESTIHPSVTAGESVSIKKSVIGSAVNIASNVKLNRCVIHSGVTISSNVNLSGCIICQDATISQAAVLKDCQVAKDSVVGGEETAKFLGEEKIQMDDDLAGAIEFC